MTATCARSAAPPHGGAVAPMTATCARSAAPPHGGAVECLMRGLRPSAMRIAILFAVLVGLARGAHADVLEVGDRVVEFDNAVDASGKPFKLKSLHGKWLLVTFGAEWCEACVKELPTWDKLAPDYTGKVTFIAMNINNEPADGQRFNKKLKLKNLVQIYLPQNKSGVVDRYASDTMPTTFVVDPNGVVKFVRAGFEKEDTAGELAKMKATLAKLVK
jgi:thiol-disulfide isomerase/thioredoxin